MDSAISQLVSGPPRTEADAEAGVVNVRMGGQPYALPALTIEQSETWQAVVGGEVASLDDGLGLDSDEDDGAASIAAALGRGAVAMTRLIVAYDVSGVLGGEANIRSHMTQRELHSATEVVLDAEFPFDEAGRRSVVEVFGLPLRALGIVSKATEDEASRRAKYPNSALLSGISPTPKSDANGRANNSQSGGRTVKGASRKTSKRA